jgi:transcriptional regulator GlxA family with amidase domain
VLTKGVFTIEETQTQIQRTLDGVGQISEARNLVRKAMGFVHENYQKPITRAEIAAYLRISEDHLTRCFRQILRVPPMTYLTRYRVNRAKALLSSGDTTVAKVAAATGFPNEFYFSYVFRRETGVAPSAFRKQQRAS